MSLERGENEERKLGTGAKVAIGLGGVVIGALIGIGLYRLLHPAPSSSSSSSSSSPSMASSPSLSSSSSSSSSSSLTERRADGQAEQAGEDEEIVVDRLQPGEPLLPGMVMPSSNGAFEVRTLADGSLVTTSTDTDAVVRKTKPSRAPRGGAQTIMWADGQICTYEGQGEAENPALHCEDSAIPGLPAGTNIFWKLSDTGLIEIRDHKHDAPWWVQSRPRTVRFNIQ